MNTNNQNSPHPLIRIFDKVYIINLAHRTDRRQEMTHELSKIGLSLDHQDILLFPAVKPEVYEGWPSRGAKGCFMSHLGVLKDALQNDYRRILIIEDDLNFTSSFMQSVSLLESSLNKLPWGILYGGYELLAPESEVLQVLPDELHDSDGLAAEKGLFTIQPSIPVRTTHFVGFSKEVIPSLVAYLSTMSQRPAGHQDGGPMHVDGAYSWFRNAHPEILTILASPQLGYQRSSATDIADKRWFDSLPILSSVIAWVRKLKNSIHAR